MIVLYAYQYELGKIRLIYEHTDLEEFLFLQDSVIIKDTKWIDEVFDHEGSVSLGNQLFMYLGKYTRETLSKVPLPQPQNKHDAVRLEREWTRDYAESEANIKTLWPDFVDTDKFEEHNGRLNMILENEHIKKYKGTWNVQMIDNAS